jgi:hypothetical protein
LTCCRYTARQSHAWAHTGLGASLERSPAATPLCCSGIGRTAQLATRCALRSDRCGESEHEARWRAPTLTLALLGVPEAPPGRCAPRRDFAGTVLALNGGIPTPGFAAGGVRRGRSVRWREAQGGVSAREARIVTCSPRLFERNGAKRNAASFAARPTPEHHSAVFAQRKPPQCEPPPGTACREAAHPEIPPQKAKTQEKQ